MKNERNYLRAVASVILPTAATLIVILLIIVLFPQKTGIAANDTAIDTVESGSGAEDSSDSQIGVSQDKETEGQPAGSASSNEDSQITPESGVGSSLPVNTGDTFEWVYKFLSAKNPKDKYVTEGEYLTIQRGIKGNTDDLGRLIQGSTQNVFVEGESLLTFHLLYYSELEAHRNEPWINEKTKDYFKTLTTIAIDDNADVEQTIIQIDRGITTGLKTTEKAKYLVYGLVANQRGYLAEMPYYDAAGVLEKLNEASNELPEYDAILLRLRSEHNGVS